MSLTLGYFKRRTGDAPRWNERQEAHPGGSARLVYFVHPAAPGGTRPARHVRAVCPSSLHVEHRIVFRTLHPEVIMTLPPAKVCRQASLSSSTSARFSKNRRRAPALGSKGLGNTNVPETGGYGPGFRIPKTDPVPRGKNTEITAPYSAFGFRLPISNIRLAVLGPRFDTFVIASSS